MNEIVRLKELKKTYDGQRYVLNGITLSINRGEIVTIMGQSGSGKSTLLNILGLLDYYTSGEYFLEGKKIEINEKKDYAQVRNEKIGFVFQSYHLIPNLSVKENLLIPLLYRKGHYINLNYFEGLLDKYLNILNLDSLKDKKVDGLSGGEKQRVGLCRVLVNDSAIILADEPTGNLDKINKEKIMNIFYEISRQLQKTVIIVTHDESFSLIADRRFRFSEGKLIEEIV